jgi:hypothetical protein
MKNSQKLMICLMYPININDLYNKIYLDFYCGFLKAGVSYYVLFHDDFYESIT